MKKVLASLIIVVLIGSASMFAMDKLTQAERAKVITAAKAAKGDEQKFQAAIKSIPKAAGITLADALPGIAPKQVQAKGGAEKGETIVQFFGEEVPLKTTPAVTTKPAAKKGIVITEAQKVALEKELEKLELEEHKLNARIKNLAMSLGNQEDAQAFWDEMMLRAGEVYEKLGEPEEPNFSSLPSKFTEEENE